MELLIYSLGVLLVLTMGFNLEGYKSPYQEYLDKRAQC